MGDIRYTVALLLTVFTVGVFVKDAGAVEDCYRLYEPPPVEFFAASPDGSTYYGLMQLPRKDCALTEQQKAQGSVAPLHGLKLKCAEDAK